jgi:serine/threonine protein kinase/tetratricopeptide (TPR) repeat protein
MRLDAANAVIDGRFEIRIPVGAGGMGVVYRARDRVTGEDVALKVLSSSDPAAPGAAGALEARALMELRHPGIVRYIAHGVTEDGSPYLAMEWLSGEDLDARLKRGPLTVDESANLIAQVADALVVPHDRGIIHRDIKPSNIFLVDGDIARPKLLDFGIAQQVGAAPGSASKAAIAGTPAYMSPEQIRGRGLDARSDFFSLGCVLFECLTGERAFSGASAVAIMARILIDEAPSVLLFRQDVPRALANLVARMLAKDRARRPSQARALADEIHATRRAGEAEGAESTSPSITAAENRPVFVVLASMPLAALENDGGSARTSRATPPNPPNPPNDGGSASSTRETRPDKPGPAPIPPTRRDKPGSAPIPPTTRANPPEDTDVARIARDHDARVEVLLDGSLLAVISGEGSALDLCVRAARCALSLHKMLPGRTIALTAGRAEIGMSLPTGQAVESAAALLAEPRPAASGVRVDAAAARLLGPRFHVERDEVSALLLREHDPSERSGIRRLMGEPTPFVGREVEIATLEALWTRGVAQSEARAVIVTGPPGIGKSRLRAEILAFIEERGGAEILAARADPMRRGAPLSLIAELIRRAAGITHGDDAEVSQRKVRERVEGLRGLPDAPRVVAFLCECSGLPLPDEDNPKLRAARQNPMLMSDQLRLAFEDLLLGLSSERPVIVAIEDLQWGDLPTMSFLDAALRTLQDRRLFVLAFGRPEALATFPNLWAERRVTRMSLAELSPGASAALVRAALGDEVPRETLARIVEQASGNPFFLEELIRAVAEGHGGEELPGSVLAMAEARLDALPESLRQVLRAASVFGETFSRAGVAVLLGRPPDSVTGELDELIEREILLGTPAPRSPARGDAVLSFRHSLMRQVAYARLTDHDLTIGHRLAADWLEKSGGADALVVAQHLERGGETARAAEAYVRAVKDTLDANDLDAALERAALARKCGVAGEQLAAIQLLEATAHHWRATFEEGERAALAALRGASPCSAPWYRAAEELAETCFPLGKMEGLAALGEALYAPPGRRGPAGAFVAAASTVAIQLFLGGQRDVGAALMQRIDAAEARLSRAGALVTARSNFARATQAMVQGDLGAVLEHGRRSLLAFDEAGDLRSAALMRTNLAFVYAEVGAYEHAEEPLRTAMSAAARLGLPAVTAAAKQNLGLVLARAGRLEEARAVEADCIAMCAANKDRRMEGNARIYLAQIDALRGDLAGGEAQARQAIELTEEFPPMQAYGKGVLAMVLLARGAVGEALGSAREAMATLSALGNLDEGEATVRLSYARALRGAGEPGAARAAVEEARALVASRAGKITDPELRESFFRRVPEHAEILALSDAYAAMA